MTKGGSGRKCGGREEGTGGKKGVAREEVDILQGMLLGEN